MGWSSIDWEDKGKKCGGPLNCDPRRSALRWLCLFPYSLPLPKKLFLHNRAVFCHLLPQTLPPVFTLDAATLEPGGDSLPGWFACPVLPPTLSFSLTLPPTLSLSFGT